MPVDAPPGKRDRAVKWSSIERRTRTTVWCALGVAWAVLGCRDSGSGALDPASALASALSGAEVLDLTYAFDEKTLYWPTAPSRFVLERLAYGPSEAGYFYAANSFCTPEHGGTHLDAPIHFGAERWTTEKIPVERLIGPAVVVDVSAQAAADRDYRLTLADLEAWEAQHQAIPRGAMVLLRTGWGKRWPDRESYFGSAAPGDASDLHFPSYGAEAAAWLVHERKVAVLGVDTASIDYGPSRDFPVHQLAAAANVAGLENLAQLERLPAAGAWVAALPIKIAGGSGGPVRVVAFLARD